MPVADACYSSFSGDLLDSKPCLLLRHHYFLRHLIVQLDGGSVGDLLVLVFGCRSTFPKSSNLLRIFKKKAQFAGEQPLSFIDAFKSLHAPLQQFLISKFYWSEDSLSSTNPAQRVTFGRVSITIIWISI